MPLKAPLPHEKPLLEMGLWFSAFEKDKEALLKRSMRTLLHGYVNLGSLELRYGTKQSDSQGGVD